jgi:hypothetical protein
MTVETAMSKFHLDPMKIPLLELISHANFPVDDLPLLDPVIVRCFPELHVKLIAVAPDEVRGKINQMVTLLSKIQQINEGKVEVDRDLLEFTDLLEHIRVQLFGWHFINM